LKRLEIMLSTRMMRCCTSRYSIMFLLGYLVYEQIQSFRLSSVIRQRRFFQNMADSESDVRTFASYVVYKGKGAVSLKVIPPTFSRVSGKDNSGFSGRTVSRDGALLFEFAPARPDAAREYDWTKKSSFSLSATECGDILAMDLVSGKEFLHDPNMGSANAGMLTKKLKLVATPDEKGAFLSLTVTDKSPSQRSICVSEHRLLQRQ